MEINSIADFRRAVRNGPYAWPGGYPLYWLSPRLKCRPANKDSRQSGHCSRVSDTLK